MNLAQFLDDYGRSTATNMLWYRDTVTGGADPNEFAAAKTVLPGDYSSGFTDVTALSGDNFRSRVEFNNLRNPDYNMGFRERQLITTGDKMVTMFLPLSAVLGSHRDIETVVVGVNHTYIIEISSHANYIHRASAAAAGKFDIQHLSV